MFDRGSLSGRQARRSTSTADKFQGCSVVSRPTAGTKRVSGRIVIVENSQDWHPENPEKGFVFSAQQNKTVLPGLRPGRPAKQRLGRALGGVGERRQIDGEAEAGEIGGEE